MLLSVSDTKFIDLIDGSCVIILILRLCQVGSCSILSDIVQDQSTSSLKKLRNGASTDANVTEPKKLADFLGKHLPHSLEENGSGSGV